MIGNGMLGWQFGKDLEEDRSECFCSKPDR